MKRIMLAVALLGGIMLTGPSVAYATVDHCDGHNVAPNVKDESGADDNDLVVAAGTRICVKASTGNTGIVIADGEDTLQEILFDNGIIDGSGEQGRDVSYWVTYPPLVEAYICVAGDIITLSAETQEAVNLLVSAYLELHVGAVQVEDEDAECEEPVVTTTTTAPPVTTTTAPPVVTTTAPPVTAPPVTAAPAAPAPVAPPAPATTLPHTGANATLIMALIGLALILLGGGFKLYSHLTRS